MGPHRVVELLVVSTPLVAPVVAGVVARARREPSRAAAWVTVAAAVAVLASGVWAATLTVDGDDLTAGSLLRVDALSAVMLIVIGRLV